MGNDVVDYLLKLGLERSVIGLVGPTPFQDNFGISSMDMGIFRNRLPRAMLGNVTDWFAVIKAAKSPEEVGYVEKAAELVDTGLEALAKTLKPGVTDRDMRIVVMCAIMQAGGGVHALNFGSTPMANPLHGVWAVQGNRVIKSGDICNAEIFAEYRGYSAQRFHTLTVGKPMKWVTELARVGQDANNAIRKVLKPGTTEDDIRNAADPIYKAAGCEWVIITHGQGMGIEPPVVMKKEIGYKPIPWEAKVGNTMNVEQTVLKDKAPGPLKYLYKKAVYYGDMVAVTETGNRRIHKHSCDIIEV
jgi:Xaa-Pro aminopeptidase